MSIRHLSFILTLLVFPLFLHAQVGQHATWKYKLSKKDIKAGDEVEIIFTAAIDKDWYMYSSDFDPNLGPTITTFTFKPDASYSLSGGVKAIKPKKKFDELWNGEYTYFIEKAEFRQKVKLLTDDYNINVAIEYQTCTDVDGRCVGGEEEFIIKSKKINESTNPKTTVIDGSSESTLTVDQVEAQATEDNLAKGNNVENLKKGIKNQEEINRFLKNSSDGIINYTQKKPDDYLDPNLVIQADSLKQAKLKEEGLDANSRERYSPITFMLFAFLAGLVALLTPCVFPMIPMTVSFFTNQSKSRPEAIRKGIFYGLSIIIIYTFIGVVISKINGPEFANILATHWAPNIFFFLIFFVFALSFFGLFEITLPSGLINKVDSQADKGGLIGILFMAFTLVLVSFSCTGPIVGAILVESAGGLVLKPILGMFAFSLAWAIPFSLFAIFPNWLSSLPKSGSWLNSVKVVLGFLELALSLKFLSVADQVYHWGILDREVYIALWVVIFALLGFYLLGKIKLPSDSDLPSVSVQRLMLSLITFSFVVYLIPGLWGAPLKRLSGYLPPQTTLDFDIPNIIAKNASVASDNTGSSTICDVKPKYSDILHLPHGLKGYFDFKQGMECAKAQQKPVFIDFTGHGCVNCREMEATVWSDPEVLKRLKNDYIVIALYVDEKKELPKEEWYTSTYDGKSKNTIGKQNADLQISRFNNNAQPFYVLLDHNGKLLVKPQAYNLDIHNFVQFLDSGTEEFKKQYGDKGKETAKK